MSLLKKYKIKNIRRRPQREVFSYGEYPKNWPKELKLAQATRHFELMKDSVELLENTLSEDMFRNRYEAAVREAQVVISLCGKNGIGIRAGRVLRYLLNEKEKLVSDFALRCMR